MMKVHVLGATLAFAVVATGCKPKKQRPPQAAVPVAVTTVKRAAVPYTISANGTVYPMQTAAVATQVDGIIVNVAFQEGQDVAKGQTLFQIDPIPYRAAYQQAVANLARDHATLVDAVKEVERYEQLVKKDYVTQEQVDQIRATAGSAQGTVIADSALMANAKFNLDNTTIRAPIGGRTGGLLVRTGNLVHAASGTPLVVINQMHPILVQFAVPATNLPDIQKYSATGSLPVTVSPTASSAPPSANVPQDPQTDAPPGTTIGESNDPALSNAPDTPGSDAASAPAAGSRRSHGPPSRPAATSAGATASASSSAAPRSGGGAAAGGPPASGYGAGSPGGSNVTVNVPMTSGTLSFVNNAVDTVTGTVLLKGTFPNPHSELWPGEYVATTLRLYIQQDALVVPQQAIMTGQTGTYVFVVDQAGTARQRPVVVQRQADNICVIGKGLAEGEKVVTDGQSRLTPGAKVAIRALATASTGSVQ